MDDVYAPTYRPASFIGWFLLKKFFPFKKKTIELEIEGEVQHNWRTAVVAVTFIITVLLWICDRWTGVGSNTVAMVPIVVFAFTGVIKARDLEEINWSVIWMVAGGFALGLASTIRVLPITSSRAFRSDSGRRWLYCSLRD